VVSLPGLVLLCAGFAEAGAVVPPGAELKVRLTTAIPAHARKGLRLSALLIAPVAREGQVLLAAGATLQGTVDEAGTLPHDHHRSYLRLSFGTIAAAPALALPIKARLLEVDNARERVDDEGRILGLKRASPWPTKLEALLLLAAHAHPVLLAAAETAKLAVRRLRRAPIAYAAGTEMTLTLVEPLEVALGGPTLASDPLDLSASAELLQLASDLPSRTESARRARPADLTNVLLLGTRDEVTQAFLAAGWTQAKPMSLKTGVKAFVALARRRCYKPAPVSLLRLEGAPPDAVFEKQTNTLAKRHHVRLWCRKELVGGTPLWLGAATHDVAIAFDRRNRTFTHRIDGHIDGERDKLMADLELTGQVRARGLVARPDVPRLTPRATGDPLATDGRLGVLALGANAALTLNK
jgi:hypothetical protein